MSELILEMAFLRGNLLVSFLNKNSSGKDIYLEWLDYEWLK